MMHRHGDGLLLRPLVRTRVVLVDERGRTTETGSFAHARRWRLNAWRGETESADHIELPVDDRAIEFLFGLRERRRLGPAHAARRRILRVHGHADRDRHDTR